jgi:hypothetical protein
MDLSFAMRVRKTRVTDLQLRVRSKTSHFLHEENLECSTQRITLAIISKANLFNVSLILRMMESFWCPRLMLREKLIAFVAIDVRNRTTDCTEDPARRCSRTAAPVSGMAS